MSPAGVCVCGGGGGAVNESGKVQETTRVLRYTSEGQGPTAEEAEGRAAYVGTGVVGIDHPIAHNGVGDMVHQSSAETCRAGG